MLMFLLLHAPGRLPCASIDSDVAGWFRSHLTQTFAEVLLGLSGPGSSLWVAGVIVAVLLGLAWKRSWHRIAALLLIVPGGALLGEGIKLLVQRQRPFVSGPFGEWG